MFDPQFNLSFCEHEYEFTGRDDCGTMHFGSHDGKLREKKCKKCGHVSYECTDVLYFAGFKNHPFIIPVSDFVGPDVIDTNSPGYTVTINDEHVFLDKFSSFDDHHLQEYLNQCIIDENYELCAEVRDELLRRSAV